MIGHGSSREAQSTAIRAYLDRGFFNAAQMAIVAYRLLYVRICLVVAVVGVGQVEVAAVQA